jgi:hypothetical protein
MPLAPEDAAFVARALRAADEALAHTARTLPYGAPNRVGNWFAQTRRGMLFGLIGRAFDLDSMKDRLPAQRAGRTQMEHVQAIAREAAQLGAGNCGEFSAVAFIHVAARGDLPAEWIHCADHDHQFVLIGRDRRAPPEDWRRWGPRAVVCDPWDAAFYAIAAITDFPDRAAYSAGYVIDAATG